MTKEPSEQELRNKAEAAIVHFGDVWSAEEEMSDIRALIAFLDAKCERAFEAGKLQIFDSSRPGGKTYAEWNESQRGGDDGK